jgi:Xaa-Pro aminopeptidase
MAAAEVDAVLVSQPESRRYLSGYRATDLPPRDSAGYLLITESGQFVLTDPRTEAQAAVEAPHFALRRYGGGVAARQALRDLVSEQRIKRIGFEAQHLPYALWQDFNGALEGVATLLPTPGLIDGLRAVKDEDEIAALRASIALDDQAFTHLARNLHEGRREQDLAWEVEEFIRTQGADGIAFDPITVSGPNAAVPHARPGERPIQAGELVLIDMGARLDGYCSDMTRTVGLGSVPPRLKNIWQIVLEAQLEAEAKVRPGMIGSEVDAIARSVIQRSGYGDAFVHGLGHGIGLEVHEPPWITQTKGDMVLEPGMVFTIEPGIYLPEDCGVRIEDIVLLTDQGAEVLPRSPKKLPLEEVLIDLDR